MAPPLDWQAPIGNAAKMPGGWTDAAGVVVLAMSDRLRVGLPVALLACRRALGPPEEAEMGWIPGSTATAATLDPVFSLEALYSYWAHCLDEGEGAPELEVDPKVAVAFVQASPVLSVVYQRCLALAELPSGEVPTFSSIVTAIRPQFRALFGRDARVEGPSPRVSSTPWTLAALGAVAVAWYLSRVR